MDKTVPTAFTAEERALIAKLRDQALEARVEYGGDGRQAKPRLKVPESVYYQNLPEGLTEVQVRALARYQRLYRTALLETTQDEQAIRQCAEDSQAEPNEFLVYGLAADTPFGTVDTVIHRPITKRVDNQKFQPVSISQKISFDHTDRTAVEDRGNAFVAYSELFNEALKALESPDGK